MTLLARFVRHFRTDSASAEHRSARLATITRPALPAVASALAVLSVWGMARMSAADEAVRPSPTTTAAKAEPSEASDSKDSSSGAFGQFLATIDDFYSQKTPSEPEQPQSAKPASETGKTGNQAAEDKAVKKETEALVHKALPPAVPQETKMVRVGRSNTRATVPRAAQPTVTKQAASEPSSVPRWARGGLLGSFFGEKEAQDDHPVEQKTQSPTPQVAQQTAPPETKRLSEAADPSHRQEAPRETGRLAKSAGAAKSWMGKMVDPLFGRDDPAELQANDRPPSRRTSVASTEGQATLPPKTRQAISPPAAPPARHTPLAYPPLNQPLAHTRPGTSRPVPRKPSLDPTVAVQFGQKYRPPAPSQTTQTQTQLAQSATPSARRAAQPPRSQTQAVTRPSSSAGDITPIVPDSLATAEPERVLPVPPVDLADVLPAVEAAASRRIAMIPDSERTPTLAEEYAQSDIEPAGPPASWNGYGTPPQTVATSKPAGLDGVAFESSINVLGLAELTGQGGKLNSTKPSTDGTPARKSPVIEVARQPRMVR
jgi:hypothetical protein